MTKPPSSTGGTAVVVPKRACRVAPSSQAQVGRRVGSPGVTRSRPGSPAHWACNGHGQAHGLTGGLNVGEAVRACLDRQRKQAQRCGLVMLVRPLSGGPHLPVNVWVATTGRTVEVRRVVLLDAAGRQIGSGRGSPASDDLLPPAGPVTVLGHAPSATGPLRVAAYDAEAAYTCIQVIPDQRPGDGFVKCAPPPPAPRPALEADGICSGGAAILYGTARGRPGRSGSRCRCHAGRRSRLRRRRAFWPGVLGGQRPQPRQGHPGRRPG